MTNKKDELIRIGGYLCDYDCCANLSEKLFVIDKAESKKLGEEMRMRKNVFALTIHIDGVV